MTQSIDTGRKLSRESKLLLWLDFGFAFSTSLSGLFLSIYLWRLTESWTVNGLYYIALFVFVVVGFIAGGWLSKRKDSLFTFRLGICLMAVFFLAVLVFQEQVAVYPVVFGLLNGLAQGFYWIAMLVLAYDLTTDDNRLKYFGWDNAVMALAGMIGPLLSGFVIDSFAGFTGYMVVFCSSLIFFVLTIIGSFFVKLAKTQSQTYLLCIVFKRTLNQMIWKKHFMGWMIMGLHEGVMLVLPPILLFQIVLKESAIGLLTVCFGIVSIASNQLLGAFGKKQHYPVYTLIAAVGMLLTTLVLLGEISVVTLVIFMIGNAFFSPAIRNSYTSHMYRLMSELPNKGERLKSELIATRQVFLTAGRILPIVVVIVFAGGLGHQLVPWILLITASSQLILYFVMTHKQENLSTKKRPVEKARTH